MRAWLSSSVVALLLLAGCGGESADLFWVKRQGADRNANVDLVVNDGGTATCNRGEPIALPSGKLLEARELARGLERQAELLIDLPRGPSSTLHYVVRTSNGQMRFFDTSPRRPPVFNELVAFSKDVIENVCRIER